MFARGAHDTEAVVGKVVIMGFWRRASLNCLSQGGGGAWMDGLRTWPLCI
jgi:hypothetical protein